MLLIMINGTQDQILHLLMYFYSINQVSIRHLPILYEYKQMYCLIKTD